MLNDQFDASRRGEKGLKSSREKNHPGMWPRIWVTTIIGGREKKSDDNKWDRKVNKWKFLLVSAAPSRSAQWLPYQVFICGLCTFLPLGFATITAAMGSLVTLRQQYVTFKSSCERGMLAYGMHHSFQGTEQLAWLEWPKRGSKNMVAPLWYRKTRHPTREAHTCHT